MLRWSRRAWHDPRRNLASRVWPSYPWRCSSPIRARFETFVAGPNATAVEHVRAAAERGAGRCGSGGRELRQGHLLQAACRAADHAGRRSMYVPLGAGEVAEPAVLAGLESVDVLALDRVERVAGAADWERVLFVLLNEIAERRGALLLAARTPPAGSGFELRDLASSRGHRHLPAQALDDGTARRALRTPRLGLTFERPAAGTC